MARIDLRLRAWGWLTRRMFSVATMSDAEVIALQARQVPANPVTNWLFGTVAPGVEVTDRSVPGPAGDLKVRLYQPSAGGDAANGDDSRPGRKLACRLLPRRRFRPRQPGHGQLAVRLGRGPRRGGCRFRGLPARAVARVPGRGRGLLRGTCLGGGQRRRAGRDRADRGHGGERGRQPGRGDLPDRAGSRRSRDQPPGANVPGHRHDDGGAGDGGPVRAVPVRGGDKHLQAALPRPGRRPRQPVGVAAAGRPRRAASGPDPGGRARPAPRRRRALRRGPARGRGPRAVHRVRRHAARLRQLPRPLQGGAPGHGRGVRGAVRRARTVPTGERRGTPQRASRRQQLFASQSCQ